MTGAVQVSASGPQTCWCCGQAHPEPLASPDLAAVARRGPTALALVNLRSRGVLGLVGELRVLAARHREGRSGIREDVDYAALFLQRDDQLAGDPAALDALDLPRELERGLVVCSSNVDPV